MTTNVSPNRTIALAVSTRARLGQAVNVVRIMPVPYSEEITSTPSGITHSVPSSRPNQAKPSFGSTTRSGSARASAVSSPMPTFSRTITPSVHIVERTERIFVHSEASAWPRVVRRTGIGET